MPTRCDASLCSARRRVATHAPISVMAVVPMITVRPRRLDRIGRIGRLDAEQPLNAANDAAHGTADDRTDRPRSLSAFLNAVRNAARDTLRLRRQGAGQGRDDRACQYDMKLHATNPSD